MNQQEENGTDLESEADGPHRADREDDETQDPTEPGTPLIDQDFAGSVNAALHDSDEERKGGRNG